MTISLGHKAVQMVLSRKVRLETTDSANRLSLATDPAQVASKQVSDWHLKSFVLLETHSSFRDSNL